MCSNVILWCRQNDEIIHTFQTTEDTQNKNAESASRNPAGGVFEVTNEKKELAHLMLHRTQHLKAFEAVSIWLFIIWTRLKNASCPPESLQKTFESDALSTTLDCLVDIAARNVRLTSDIQK
jgi:hypothetical protein